MTVSDVLAAEIEAASPHVAGPMRGGTRARVRARLAVTDGDGKAARVWATVAYCARVVWSDVAGAWPWRGTPPTLAELWAARIPDIDRVPTANRALWVAWIVFNHVVLAVTAPLYVLLFAFGHPARFLMAAAVVAPLIVMWI